MTAILGRMATTRGKIVKWDEAVSPRFEPKNLAWDAERWSSPAPTAATPARFRGDEGVVNRSGVSIRMKTSRSTACGDAWEESVTFNTRGLRLWECWRRCWRRGVRR